MKSYSRKHYKNRFKEKEMQTLTLAVTGHRDLRQNNTAQLKQSVKEVLLHIQKEYPQKELSLLSALAEGADMLVAEVALELGISLCVTLPYEKEKYLQSFALLSNKEKFERLYSQATETIELLQLTHTLTLTKAYENLGVYLTQHASRLMALWDGEYNGKQGGTSEVVKMMQQLEKKVYHIPIIR
jgi:hypothetical protein